MSGESLYNGIVLAWIALSLVVFPLLLFLTAPYGRHTRAGWGPSLPNRLGWILMELPSVAVFLYIYLRGPRAGDIVPLTLLTLWQAHYLHRAFIFPFRMRGPGRPMPILIALSGFAFNVVNSWANASRLTALGPAYPDAWFHDPRFVIGVLLFVAGYAINFHADRVLFNLRAPGETGYKIPRGGLYRWVSCPNYFGELLEWTGWAVATWSLAGAAFALWTAANLVPRALSHHQWYRQKFADYPRERAAVIPFLL